MRRRNQSSIGNDNRIMVQFGSPKINGRVDKVWEKAQWIFPKYKPKEVEAKAKFKLLWNDYGIYVLAVVKDKRISVESELPHMQDTVEVFVDEFNEKSQEYGEGAYHFRVNCDNYQTIDHGKRDQFYSCAVRIKDGYMIQARIGTKSILSNHMVLGIELQVNDAVDGCLVGSINCFDHTGQAWRDASVFGEMKLIGKRKGARSGLNPYPLLIKINMMNELDRNRYVNGDMIDEAIKTARKVLNYGRPKQENIDYELERLKQIEASLQLTEEAANEKEFIPVPSEYKKQNKYQGSIERLVYQVENPEGKLENKNLNVYLPFGYDEHNPNKKYNVLYLMHGGGENENLLFGGPGENKELKRILDHMIANQEIEPLIVVTPSFYGGKNVTEEFHHELQNQIIPMVEMKYHTHLQADSKEAMKASRNHRAFGGFSMGSVTTWYNFIHSLDYIKYFIPLCGDCWIYGQKAGSYKAKETAEYLANNVKQSGYGPKDYYILGACGDLDIAYPNLAPQMEAMRQLKDTFIYSSDHKKGNFYFLVCKGGTHAWNWVNQYIYDILPDLFVDERENDCIVKVK